MLAFGCRAAGRLYLVKTMASYLLLNFALHSSKKLGSLPCCVTSRSMKASLYWGEPNLRLWK